MSILVKDLSLKQSKKQLLRDINFELIPGEMIAVVGENGAGKTSLLQCLAGDFNCHNNIHINDTLINSYSLQQLARLRAVLSQSNDLTFPFSVIEVVRLGLTLSSINNTQQTLIIEECLKMVDGWQYRDRNYTTLSGGEKQRVQLARVLAQISTDSDFPRYLLLDEPTSALDMKHQFETLKMLKSLCGKNVGILIILHDINLAAMYCDRIMLLKNGRLLNIGSPTEVLQRHTIQQGFGVDVHILNHPNSETPFMINHII